MKYIAFLFGFVWCSHSLIFAQNNTETGIASYYIDKFDGRETASGERFDNTQLVASHRKLPFNTMVLITNLSNQKKVIVRIIDRGPYAHGRILDMSKAAAQRIGLTSTGTAKVELRVVGFNGKISIDPDIEAELEQGNEEQFINTQTNQSYQKTPPFSVGHTFSPEGTLRQTKGYGVQLGVFSTLENAKELCNTVSGAAVEPVFVQVVESNGKVLYKVLVGMYMQQSEAVRLLEKLKERGFEGFVKTHLASGSY
ncbi:MAG: septal ring lytic transglycosylase RlpA family protein [Cytophagales bacterium]|nr:MAG: septal ring lytic transglycosylase RlpA family protein [Cytophagales bacterium]